VCAVVVAVSAVPADAIRQQADQDVAFKSGALTLAGTLSLPSGAGPFRAVVLLSGSGPQNRDAEIAGFRPFKLIAEHFVKRGIAVLRVDDRGVGGSTGNLFDATTEDLAADALAAMRTLRDRSDIDGKRIGLIGHSEGALVAAVAAARSSEVAFIGYLAGSAVSGAEILRQQAAEIPRRAGASPAAIEEILRHHDALMAAVKENATAETLAQLSRSLMAKQRAATQPGAGAAPADADAQSEALIAQSVKLLQTPWMRFFVTFDPAAALRRVTCPVFAAFGGRDVQVPEAVNRARLEAALKTAGNLQVTVRVYPDANHLFMPAITGQVTEYATLPKVFVPSLLDDLATWVASR
jgi:pimeloyl-ACP methyl ester carboxylesterase